MKICINAGHTITGPGSGSIGIKNESAENRKVKDDLIKILKSKGHTIVDATVDKASSTSEYLKKCVSIANQSKADLFISIHFNAYDTKANGVEVLVYDEKSISLEIAQEICREISSLGFKNRNVKARPDLYVLKSTTMPALLVECCFIDNSSDMNIYNPTTMAKSIAKCIEGDSKLYKVCIGAYKSKDNAVNMRNKAIAQGFKDAYIIE